MCIETSVTRLGDFFNFFVTNLLSKVGIIIGDLWGYFEINHFLGKTAVDTFWQTLRRNWTTFYSAIWSHYASWSLQIKNKL